MQRGETFDAVFRQHHAEQMRAYMTAVTSQLYQRGFTLVLPYQYDVLAVARRFLDADMYDVAVIMAQTAVEIATDDIVATLLRRHNLPPAVQTWIGERIERIPTLKTDALYDLYRALSGNELRRDQKTMWEAYVRRADLRNDIVHTGAHATKQQAVEACDTALDLIHHFEAVIQ